MPLQNRVIPSGEIISDPSRAAKFMGNRGILHDDERRLGRARWRHRAWIVCALSFNGRRRTLMAPGSYTELFFLDEAVAFAAGHRPCGECRREAYLRFLEGWGERDSAAGRKRQNSTRPCKRRASKKAADPSVGMKATWPRSRMACSSSLPVGTATG
jgi:hypothetical protein